VGKTTSTNPVEIDAVKSTLAGAISQFVPNQGFILTKVSIYSHTAGTGTLNA
jgi:hypothetical protein